MAEKTYPEVDRRKDCHDNCPYAEQAKKSTPRVYFLASWSALVICLIAFAGWHVSSMDKLREENRVAIEAVHVSLLQDQLAHKKQMDEILAATAMSYTQDVERFIRATSEIRKGMDSIGQDIGEIKVENARFNTIQEMVMKKIKLTDP